MSYPANYVQNEGPIRHYTAGIPPQSPQAINAFASHGAVRASPTAPITQPGPHLSGQDFSSWGLGGLQGPQLSQHGFGHGNSIPKHNRGPPDAQGPPVSTTPSRAAISTSSHSRTLVQRSSPCRPSFHPYSQGRASFPHTGSQRAQPTATICDMSRILDPVEEAFFGPQPIPHSSHGIQAPSPAMQNPGLGQASKSPVLLPEQDAPPLVPLSFDHAVTAWNIHDDPLSLLQTPSLPPSDFWGPLFAGDAFLNASERVPNAEHVEPNDTHDFDNITGTAGLGAPHDDALDDSAIDAILAILPSLGSPKDLSPTSDGGQATGTSASTSPSSQSSPSDSDGGRASPRAKRNGVKRQGRKSATKLQNILAKMDPVAYTRAQLMQKGLTVGENEMDQIVQAHVGIDLARCPPYYVPVEIPLWLSLIDLAKSGQRINAPAVKALGAAFKGKQLTTQGHTTFNCSGSWIDAFRKRHAINWNGEIDISLSGTAPEGAMPGWVNFLRQNHPEILKA